MRVLITNSHLGIRGGTQTVVRQTARALQELGHTVVAYSSDASEGERLIQHDLLPVATDIENLPFVPDIIHGQHHLDCMTALGALPDAPAIFYSHGAVWRGSCPKHPRLYRYLAMSRTLRERIVAESNIDPRRIDVHLNSVDITVFRTVRTPPAAPRRALFFNSRHGEDSPTFQAIREAAARAGLALDCVGWGFAEKHARPETLLPDYDVVFASGLSAMEALATGCAVMVLGRNSCGALVTSENFDRFREANFSVAANVEPPTAEAVADRLAAYDPADVAAVSARLRLEADHRSAAVRLVGFYESVIEEHARTPRDPREESRAMSRYLRRLVPLILAADEHMGRAWSSQWRATSMEELSLRIAGMEKELKRLAAASDRA